MRVGTLRRIARNVADIGAAAEFYTLALGFAAVTGIGDDTALAKLLGCTRVRGVRMRLGGRQIELTECFPSGAAYPAKTAANDLLFQHIAIVTQNITESYQRALTHGAVAISAREPQTLPASSGGVTAWKFRDPDGHPLELLQFQKTSGISGYDHTAIVVADVEKSMAFYNKLGLSVAARSLNLGAEQEALDGLAGAVVDVVALRGDEAVPHIELLHYRAPACGAFAAVKPADIAADRTVFSAAGAGLLRDPDGHFVLFEAGA